MHGNIDLKIRLEITFLTSACHDSGVSLPTLTMIDERKTSTVNRIIQFIAVIAHNFSTLPSLLNRRCRLFIRDTEDHQVRDAVVCADAAFLRCAVLSWRERNSAHGDDEDTTNNQVNAAVMYIYKVSAYGE